MKRKLALLTAVFMLVFSLSSLASGFSDMPKADSEYYAAFEYAISAKIISGVDGKLLPDNPITKAEAVTFISRAKPFTAIAADLSAVTDISSDAWYYKTMAQAVAAKVIAPDANNALKPTEALTRRAAWDLLHKTFGNSNSYTPVTEGDKLATRGDFILWLFNYVKPSTQQPTEPASGTTSAEEATEAPTEAKTEYNDLKALKAQEDMRVALGIRADGTSYIETVVYKDTSQTDWASGKISSSSSRPSGGSSNNRPSDDDDDEDDNRTEPTQAPEDEPTEDTNTPTEPETQAPTEPETQAPTYGEYDGPIDNDKDNVIDDPFNDNWTPPGSGGNTDDDDNTGDTDDSGGSGGFDEEDDDFNINDDDDPYYEPETKPTEPETEAPTDEETNAPTDEETNAPTDEETNAPSDDETNAPSDDETNVPSDDETNVPSDDETNVPSDDETNAPADEDTDSTDENPTTAPEEESGKVTEDSKENGEEADSEKAVLASLFSKDWWFN